MLTAQEYGAAAILIYNNETSGSGFRKIGGFRDEGASPIKIPTGSIPRSTARHIYRFREKKSMDTVHVRFLGVDFHFGPSHENIADFSSFGPTEDGRIKPELVAPGADCLTIFVGKNPVFDVSACGNVIVKEHDLACWPRTVLILRERGNVEFVRLRISQQ